MSHFSFWKTWLLLVAIAITLFGIFMSLFNGTALFAPFDANINPVFWGQAPLPESTIQFQRWVFGAWGATVGGWGVLLIYVAAYPIRRKEPWAWKSIMAGLVVWFVLDTSLSLLHKVYFNAAFNFLIFLLAVTPLCFLRKTPK